MRETNDPHVAQSGQIAPDSQSMPLSATTNTSNGCPSGASVSTPAVSPLFEGAFVHSLQFDLDADQKTPKTERKRRRVIGNLDNTLDGLVAKRADAEPNAKRYQTETEAIELPDDETEMKRLETDPDVSTRMCSICGYQGKWVSEMIRHKRVHTSDRPFKCKYCNRTSKWKADLIRHVAKTHGIRVVSKYSRSKAFDSQGSEQHIEEPAKFNCGSRKRDANNNSKFNHQSVIHKPLSAHSAFKFNFPPTFGSQLSVSGFNSTPFSAPPLSSSIKSPTPMQYKCNVCAYEQDSMDLLTGHLRLIHELPPFECQQCQIEFGNVQAVTAHCAQLGSTCTPLQIKINFQITGTSITAPQPSIPKPEGLLTVATSSSASNNLLSLANDSDTASSSAPSSCSSSTATDHELSTQPGLNLNACPECPYRTPSTHKLVSHRLGHQMPKGLFNYKCVFCNWFAKKKSAIEKHMQVHTSKPSQFMPQVERNLITPLTTSSSNTFLPTSGAFIGGGASAPNLIGPLAAAAPSSAASAFGLLSALYSAGGSFMSGASPIAPTPLQTTPSLPDVGAFKELTTNPLLAFGLCSLLKDLNSQQQQLPAFCPMVSTSSTNSLLSAFDSNNSHLI